MGVLIRIKGAKFVDPYIITTVEVPTCKHVYDDGVVTKTPTCTEDGIITYTCTLCGATKTEVVPAVAHNYVDGACAVCGKALPVTIADYPVQDGLQGLYDLGGTAEASVTNHAQKPTYTPSGGTPKLEGVNEGDIAGNYVTFSGATNGCRLSTYLRIPLVEEGLTYVALFSVTEANGKSDRPIISNCNGSGGVGFRLGNCGVRYVSNGVAYAPPNYTYDTPIVSDKFAILAVTFDANGYRVVRYTNNRIVEWDAKDTVITDWGGGAIQLGGESTSSVSTATAHISLAAVHTGKLTDAQLEEVCKFVYDYGVQKHGEENIE
ncbi:MAG: hypothetical protein IKW46_07455 [Bacteroidaceae bacterium]|nr:hypothetical protein [Bacteroidaceae bacterium]